MRVRVDGAAPYDVHIGRGLAGLVPDLLPGAERVAVIFTGSVAGYAQRVAAALSGRAVEMIEVPAGEAAKTLRTAGECWDRLGAAGFTRSDAVVGLGGGAVTDLAGWVAAAWLRGVALVQAPTTLLGMVDAAIGGKTAINIAAGKNLVGAFHPPVAVLADTDLLASVPAPDYRAGLAEVVKAGFIADPVILERIEADPAAAGNQSADARDLIERAVRVKAQVVAEDLTETGRREMLNYGHTLAHAIEALHDYTWRHGDAVSIGMVYAAELGRLAGRTPDALAARHASVLRALGLPVSYSDPDRQHWPRLRAAMAVDKKARGSTLRFVVLDGLGSPGMLADPGPDLLRQAYEVVAR